MLHGQKISHQPLVLVDRTQGNKVTVAKESASKYFPGQDVTEAVCNFTKLGRVGKSQSETLSFELKEWEAPSSIRTLQKEEKEK